MKKLTSILLSIVMVFSLVYVTPLGLQTVSAEVMNYDVPGGQVKFDTATGSITGYTGSPTEVVIPSQINGVNVVSIGSQAFNNCRSLISINIPNVITSIRDRAFWGCSNLSNIQIPDSVTSIGYYAFYACGKFTNISIPNSITTIENGVFSSCYTLNNISIPNSVTSIGDSAFRDCYYLSIVNIPNSVISIGKEAFFGSRLSTVNIPSSVTNIGNNAFNTYYINTINVDANNTAYLSIDGVLFNKSVTDLIQCPSGKSGNYQIPDSVIRIADGAFQECSRLINVDMPDGLINIGNNSFLSCNMLEDISIPSSVTNIGEAAFRYCYKITNIIIPNGVTSISIAAFQNCNKLNNIIIPDSVTNIGISAFWECSSLTGIDIPGSVTNIGANAFSGCSNLSDAYFYGNAPVMETNVFNLTKLGFTIHYQAGKTGFSNPWYGYPTLRVGDSEESTPTPTPTQIPTPIPTPTPTPTVTPTATPTPTTEPTATPIPIPVTGISINKPNISLISGQTELLKVNTSPYNATDKSMIWSITSQSSPNAVTVAGNGLLTAISRGTAVARVTSAADNSKYAEINITVNELSSFLFKAIAAGFDHSVAVKKDGNVIAWGKNMWGECDIPLGLANVKKVAAGYHSSMALKDDGTVFAWGSCYAVPFGLSHVTDIACGDNFNVALKDDGSIVVWGNNSYGVCNIPEGVSKVKSIAASGVHIVIVKEDGTVDAWGLNNGGACNIPFELTESAKEWQGDSYIKAVKVVTDGSHSAAFMENGTLIAWGSDTDNTINNSISKLSDIKDIAAGGYGCTFVFKTDGEFLTYGENVEKLCDIPAGLSNVTDVAVGYEHFIALKEDGTIVIWGRNNYGQCLIPVPILPSIIPIENRTFHINNFIYNNEKFVAVGNDGIIATSEDGRNWDKTYLNTLCKLNGITWNGREFIAFGQDNAIYLSSNGEEWINVSHGRYANLIYDILWDGEKYITAGYSLTSVDGKLWSNWYNNNSGDVTSIVRNNLAYIETGKDNIYYSNNGYNWSGIKLEDSTYFNASTCNENTFLVVGNNYAKGEGVIYKSFDGKSWTKVTLSGGFPYIKDIEWSGHEFVFTSNYGVWTSIDGEEWVKINSNNYYTKLKMCGNSLFALDESNNTICEVDLPVPVTSVMILNKEISLYLGEYKTINYSIEPNNAANKEVSFEVVENGQNAVRLVGSSVFGNSPGTAKIKVTTVDGNKQDYCTVVVSESASTPSPTPSPTPPATTPAPTPVTSPTPTPSVSGNLTCDNLDLLSICKLTDDGDHYNLSINFSDVEKKKQIFNLALDESLNYKIYYNRDEEGMRYQDDTEMKYYGDKYDSRYQFLNKNFTQNGKYIIKITGGKIPKTITVTLDISNKSTINNFGHVNLDNGEKVAIIPYEKIDKLKATDEQKRMVEEIKYCIDHYSLNDWYDHISDYQKYDRFVPGGVFGDYLDARLKAQAVVTGKDLVDSLRKKGSDKIVETYCKLASMKIGFDPYEVLELKYKDMNPYEKSMKVADVIESFIETTIDNLDDNKEISPPSIFDILDMFDTIFQAIDSAVASYNYYQQADGLETLREKFNAELDFIIMDKFSGFPTISQEQWLEIPYYKDLIGNVIVNDPKACSKNMSQGYSYALSHANYIPANEEEFIRICDQNSLDENSMNYYAEAYIYKRIMSKGIVTIACPVTVEIYYGERLVATLDNTKPVYIKNEYGVFYSYYRGDDLVKRMLLYNPDLRFIVRGTDNGLMQLTVMNTDGSGAFKTVDSIKDIAVTPYMSMRVDEVLNLDALGVDQDGDGSIDKEYKAIEISNPTNLNLSRYILELPVNCLFQLNYEVSLQQGVPDLPVWWSEDRSVAAVNANGLVKANGIGETDIYISIGNGLVQKCHVKVTELTDSTPTISIEPFETVPTNKDITVTAVASEGTLNPNSHLFEQNGSYTFILTADDGLIVTKTVIITNIDKDKPVISLNDYIKTPTSNAITVTATANEGTLNAANHTFIENGSFDFVAADDVGNVTTKTVNITNIDKEKPVIYIITPIDGTTYTLNQKVLANWSATDTLSGITSANGTVTGGEAIDTSSVGSNVFTVTASDKAGNITTKTVTYKVIYAFGGILQPLDSSGSNTFKAGSTIPIKFQLKDANNKYLTNVSAKIFYTKISNGSSSAEQDGVSSGSSNSDNKFRCDGNQYIFNLSTKGWATGTYQLTIKLDDGTSYTVQIRSK